MTETPESRANLELYHAYDVLRGVAQSLDVAFNQLAIARRDAWQKVELYADRIEEVSGRRPPDPVSRVCPRCDR